MADKKIGVCMTAPIFIILTDQNGKDILINCKDIKYAQFVGKSVCVYDEDGSGISVEETPREIYNLIQAEIRKSM